MFNDQLLNELKAQLDLLKQPGPFPVNPVIEKALQLIHQLMEGAEGSGGGSDPRVDQLVLTVDSHTGLLSTIQEKLLELEEKVNNSPSTEDVQTLIDASLGPVQDNIQQLFNEDKELDQRVTVLENNPPGGVSEERVKEIVDEKLTGIKADINQLKQVDIPEINAELAALDARVKALEEEPPGEGASKAWVLSQIEAEVNAINSLINNIKTNLENKLGQKANKSSLNAKADKSALNLKADKAALETCKEELETALSGKADQSALASKADRSELDGKADTSALNSMRADLETQIGEKASSSDLESCKEELETALSEKANQSALALKADQSELDSKADTSTLDSLRTDLEAQIGEKASSSDLESCKEELETALSEKADQSALALKADQSELDSKADTSALDNMRTDLEAQIGEKASSSDLESCKEELETALSEKVDQSALASKADRSELDGKADTAALDSMRTDLEAQIGEKASSSDLESCKEELETALSEKADQSALASKADRSELDGKADTSTLDSMRTDLETQIGEKASSSDLESCKEELETALSEKADQSALASKADQSELDGKADTSTLDSMRTDLETQIGEKASSSDLESCKEELETALSEKADQSALVSKADQSELDGKADTSALDSMRTDLETQIGEKASSSELEACKEELETSLSGKADQSALASKADQSELDDTRAALEEALNSKADSTALDSKADVTALDDTRTALEEALSGKANISDLEACKEELGSAIEEKADKTELNELENEVEAIREEFLEEKVNNPGLRLARLTLQGWGIVGGFELYSDDKDYIHITPGVGVSPMGELITEPGIWPTDSNYESYLEATQEDDDKEEENNTIPDTPCGDPCNKAEPQNLVFSHYVPLDEELMDYCFFKKVDTGEAYKVWKLLQPDENLPEHSRPLTPQNDAETDYPFITNKVLGVMLVEGSPLYFLMEREDVLEQLCCLPRQCNDDPKYDPDYIYEEDYSLEDNYVSDEELWACLYPAIRLPEVPLFRFGFFTDQDCAPDELDETNFPSITSIDDLYHTWSPIIAEAISSLEKALKMLINRYHYSLFPLQEKTLIEEKMEMLSVKWTRFQVSNQDPQTPEKELGSKYYAQCFYDWLRDLIAAYHELRWGIIELMNDLRPYTEEMLKRQNRHLLLGVAHQSEATGIREPLRDVFHQPPVYNGNAARLETCRLYYQRLFQMIDGFYLEDFAPNIQVPGWCYNENEDGETEEHVPNFDCLKITPGKSYIHPLSEQSIPYYYPLLFHPQSLHHFWNYQRSKTRSADRILSYHATDLPTDFPSYTNRKEIIRPLYYNLDAFDFYRIEGYLGKSEVCLYLKEEGEAEKYDVAEALQYLVQKHNLDFQVVKINLSDLQYPKGGNTLPYTIGDATSKEKAYSLTKILLGAEHLGGVFKGGAYILVYETPVAKEEAQKQSIDGDTDAPRVIASFSLPDKLPRELFVES